MLKSIGRLIGLSVLAATLGVSAPALAVTTLEFSGAVTGDYDPLNAFPVLTGTAFTGTFAFDETASDLDAGADGFYKSIGAGYGATLSGGPYSVDLTGDVTQITLSDGPSGTADRLRLIASNTVEFGGLDYLIQLTILLLDTSGAALVGDGLVTPTLALFPSFPLIQIDVTDVTNRKTGTYFASLDTLAAVPVPAALPLLGAGLAALGFMGWRKKRAAVAA